MKNLKGKVVKSFKEKHRGCDNKFVIVFEDGTRLEWGYEDCEGHTEIEKIGKSEECLK